MTGVQTCALPISGEAIAELRRAAEQAGHVVDRTMPHLPEPPASVDVMVQGAPRGARIWRDGKLLGDSPGPVSIPFGDEAVMLTVVATGHESTNVFVVPNHASSATVVLKKRAPGAAATRDGIPRDLENPF